ncbi:MFS transporter, partial [Staphylococcus gallinarum]
LVMAILIWTIGIESSAVIIIVCLSLFIVFFGLTWGPILWVMLPEMFPMRARGAATGLATLVLNFGTLIVAQLFPVLNSALSTEWVFLIFAFIGILAMYFVIKYLPETRGRSLEEIEYDLRERTTGVDLAKIK